MQKIKQKFKKGVASFYIVAFSTLILVVIAASFAMVVVAEIQRTSNDDLSQSAYDAALAGVEDAKLAYSNYRRCIASKGVDYRPSDLSSGPDVNCDDIIYWMQNPNCDMVGHMTGRLAKYESSEVAVNDTDNSGDENDTNQAYTCVQIQTTLSDYRATLNASNQVKVVKVEFKNTTADKITGMKLSWYMNREDTKYEFTNFSGGRVTFQPTTSMPVAAPPTLEFQLIQTAKNFNLNQVMGVSQGETTDRATMFFVPIDEDESNMASSSKDKNYEGIYSGGVNGVNALTAKQIVKSNDHYISNVPYGTYCGDRSNDFACAVQMTLPSPIGGERNNDTFMFVVALPYGEPETDFSLEFYTDNGFENKNLAEVDGAQVVVDSTGRANDLYRRVEVRLETSDTSFPYPYYALQLLGDEGDSLLNKNLTVTKECNFYDGNGSNC
ncbi:hypothetical protein IJG04_01140 [Candidatus Saccharibacteria bacterium]|nr:hypothetical protein [Candidatus Saccharibacteria bacterium]